MLRDIELNFWPTATNAFHFSADGQLCIPSDNRVYILANPCLNPLSSSVPPVADDTEREASATSTSKGRFKRPATRNENRKTRVESLVHDEEEEDADAETEEGELLSGMRPAEQ